MWTTLYCYLCKPYSMLTTTSLLSIYHHRVDLLYPIHPSPCHSPSDNHHSVACVYMFVFVWFDHLFFCLFLFIFNIPHTSEIIQYLSFSVWLISLSIIPSRFIHVVKKCWLNSTLESPLNSREIKPVSPKGNQPWILIGRIDAEAEAQILWQPDMKRWLIGKDPDAGKNWGQEDKERMKWLDGITDSMGMNLSNL